MTIWKESDVNFFISISKITFIAKNKTKKERKRKEKII